MKDAIKSIVIDELKKHGITDTGVLSAIGSTIATRLDKAIGIDEDGAYEVILNWYRKWGAGTQRLKQLTKDLSKSRPLKCEEKDAQS